MGKSYRCIACKRPVETMGAVASGPACIPCFWAAKLKFENGITTMEAFDKLGPDFAWQLQEFFRKCNCTWPDELVNRWENVDFEKVAKLNQEWWFERSRPDA